MGANNTALLPRKADCPLAVAPFPPGGTRALHALEQSPRDLLPATHARLDTLLVVPAVGAVEDLEQREHLHVQSRDIPRRRELRQRRVKSSQDQLEAARVEIIAQESKGVRRPGILVDLS